MQFPRRAVLYTLSAIFFAGWLLAERVKKTDLPAAVREIQEGVQRLTEEVKSLQSAVKDLALVSRHGTTTSSSPSDNLKANLERAREAYDRAIGLERLKFYPSAVEAYTEVILLDPQNEAAFLHRGTCFAQLDELENALADVNQSLRLQPNNSRAYCARAQIESKIGQNERAWISIIRWGFDPNYSEARLLRGELFQRAGDSQRAIDDFTSVISAAPDSDKAYLKRSEVFRKTGQMDSALTDCNHASQVVPSPPLGFSAVPSLT